MEHSRRLGSTSIFAFSTQCLRAASHRVQSGAIRTIGRFCSQGDDDPNLQLVGHAVALWSWFFAQLMQGFRSMAPRCASVGSGVSYCRKELHTVQGCGREISRPMNPQSPLARPFLNFTICLPPTTDFPVNSRIGRGKWSGGSTFLGAHVANWSIYNLYLVLQCNNGYHLAGRTLTAERLIAQRRMAADDHGQRPNRQSQKGRDPPSNSIGRLCTSVA